MNGASVYVGGFSYELGELEYAVEDLEEIKEFPEKVSRLKSSGFSRYRTSKLSVLDLAGKSINKLFSKVDIAPESIDAVIFATSSIGVNNHLSHRFLCDFLLEHGLHNAYPLMSSLSFCGNLMPAFKKGYNYILSGEYKHILLIVADIVSEEFGRIAPPDLAVGSDAAASCLLSVNPEVGFEISDIHESVNSQAGLYDPARDFPRYVKAVSDGIRSVANKTLVATASPSQSVTRVFTNNYNEQTCKSYLRLLGLHQDKIDLSNISRFGHAGAADICINICDYLENHEQGDEESFLLLSSGPFMWGSALIRPVKTPALSS